MCKNEFRKNLSQCWRLTFEMNVSHPRSCWQIDNYLRVNFNVFTALSLTLVSSKNSSKPRGRVGKYGYTYYLLRSYMNSEHTEVKSRTLRMIACFECKIISYKMEVENVKQLYFTNCHSLKSSPSGKVWWESSFFTDIRCSIHTSIPYLLRYLIATT